MSILNISEVNADTCYDGKLVVDAVFDWNLSERERLEFYLPSSNGYITEAALHLQPMRSNYAEVLVDFVSPKMSLAYNLYKVEITIGGYTYSEDLMENCTKHGKSIYPTQFIRLNSLFLPNYLQGKERVHIRVWGHL